MRLSYYTRIVLLLFPLLFITSPLQAQPGTAYLVTEVHDGDTVSVKVKHFAGIPLKVEKVRLIGIDAPELKQEPWGRRAKKHLKELISRSGWVVHMELDVEQRDQYGRLLGYLWSRDRGILINEQMVENGYAMLYTFPPNIKYADRLASAQKRAQAANAGVWGKQGLKKRPGEWRKENPRE